MSTRGETVGDLLTRATTETGVDRLDCELLLANALHRSRTWVFAHRDERVAPADKQRFCHRLERRADDEPLAYITGTREFYSREFSVTGDTLIPRPETESLVDAALAKVSNRGQRVIDLGTGSGCIAITLQLEARWLEVTATERSAAALAIARANARRYGVDTSLHWQCADWFAGCCGTQFDLVVSNPPYVEVDAPELRGALRYEPQAALVSGHDGLDAIRAIVREAPTYIRNDGWLILEHGARQGESVRRLFSTAGFVDVRTGADLAGHERLTEGRIDGPRRS